MKPPPPPPLLLLGVLYTLDSRPAMARLCAEAVALGCEKADNAALLAAAAVVERAHVLSSGVRMRLDADALAVKGHCG